MSLSFFVDGRRVSPHAPGDLLSEDAISQLHGDDFIRTFGAEMFRRLPLAQQAAVVRAWTEAYSAKNKERREAFESLLEPILAAA